MYRYESMEDYVEATGIPYTPTIWDAFVWDTARQTVETDPFVGSSIRIKSPCTTT